jgi:hypothetical protein
LHLAALGAFGAMQLVQQQHTLGAAALTALVAALIILFQKPEN